MDSVVIITGGECKTKKIDKFIDKEIIKNSFIIAADSGYDTALALGIVPDLLVGDMDSIKEVPDNIESVRVKSEKDDTDTMLAINIALTKAPGTIYIIGGGGGRIDHLLSNIFMLENLKNRGINAFMSDGTNMVSVIKNEEVKVRNIKGYFGIIALEDSTVSAKGCKYPLTEATLKRDFPYAVSNEVTGEFASVEVKGKCILTMSLKK